MFHETITSTMDNIRAETECGEDYARCLLMSAVRRRYTVEATRQGGAVIVRDIRGGAVPYQRIVTLEPVTPAGKVTATMRLDLAIIDRRAGKTLAARLEPGTRRIDAGLNSIPPAAAARLISRGLVTVTGTSVAVSLAARLAMLAQDHRTETREPRGYVRPADIGLGHLSVGLNKPGGRAGRIYDGSSVASCSCRRWSYPAEDRDHARRRAHEHRQQVTAEFVSALAA